jgi:hypothetical protein
MLKSVVIGAAVALCFAAPALACTDISSKTIKLTGCVDDGWQAQDASGAVEFSYQTSDQNYALQVVTETEALAAQELHDALIANAVAAVGNKDNVKELGERVENIDGKPFNVLEYQLTDGTNTVIYQNAFYSQPGFGTVQIVMISSPDMANAAAFKEGQFAATVKLGS